MKKVLHERAYVTSTRILEIQAQTTLDPAPGLNSTPCAIITLNTIRMAVRIPVMHSILKFLGSAARMIRTLC